MLTDDDIREQLSLAYIHAVASHAGFAWERTSIDRDGVDGRVLARGFIEPNATLKSPLIGLQLKATSTIIGDADPIVFPLKQKNYDDLRGRFAEGELALRERFGLPPLRRMARLVVRHESAQTARAEAELLAERLRAIAPADVDVRPPAPCPLERISDRWRMQVEVLAEKAAPLQKLLADARTSGVVRPGEALAVDVDPISLM